MKNWKKFEPYFWVAFIAIAVAIWVGVLIDIYSY